MKKIILLSLTMFTAYCGYTQTEKGKMKLGGFLNLYNNNSKNERDSTYKTDQNYFSIQIMPEFGYFINDNFELGARIIFGISNQENSYYSMASIPNEQTSLNKTSEFGLGVYVRRHKQIMDKFFFFINGSLSYTYEKSISESSGYKNGDRDSNKYNISISPGLTYFITPKLGIQALFGNLYCEYSTSKDNILVNENNQTDIRYGVSLNFSSFYLGMNYYF